MTNYLLILLSNIFFTANSIVLIISYSHFGSTADSANLSIALATISPIYVLLSLQHNISITARKLDWASSLKTRIYLAPAGLLFSILASILLNNTAILLFYLLKTAEYFYEPLFYRLIQLKQHLKLARQTLLRFGLSTTASFYLASNEDTSLTTALATLALLHALLTVLALLPSRAAIIKADRAGIRHDILLGIGSLLASIAANMPRYFLAGGPVDDIAFYSNTLSIVFGLTFIFTSLNTLLLTKFSAATENGMLKYQMYSIAIGTAFLITLAALITNNDSAAKLLVGALLGKNYLPYSDNVIFFGVFYVILYFQAVANSSLIHSGSKRFIASYNLLYLLSIIITLFAFTEKSAQSTILSVIYTSGIVTLISFTYSLHKAREAR